MWYLFLDNNNSSSTNFASNTSQEPSILLNRTQRRYTIVDADSSNVPNDENTQLAPIYINNEFLNEPNHRLNVEPSVTTTTTTTTTAAYCRVNYDFTPESDEDLGCSSGELLRIEAKINDEWIKCSNCYGKIGIVPISFVSMMSNESGDDQRWHVQGEIILNEPISQKKSNPPVLDLDYFTPIESYSNFSTNSNNNINKSNNSNQLNGSSTNELKSNTTQKQKPPIPPKPNYKTKPIIRPSTM